MSLASPGPNGLTRSLIWACPFITLLAVAAGCTSADQHGNGPARAGASGVEDAAGSSGADSRGTTTAAGGSNVDASGAGSRAGSGSSGAAGARTGAAGSRGYPDAFDPNDAPPQIGEPGCGFVRAAFCDTFGGPAAKRSRGGELDGLFWSGSRTYSQVSTTRALGIGMAAIPECRPDLPGKVWPDQDALICDPTFDLASKHLLVATAAQFYGQNSYRIRQPFDFAGRTGHIVFDASTEPLGPLRGWLSLAVVEDPLSVPGYSILGNDEGSVIPRSAVEVHFTNIGDESRLGVRNVHVFRDYVDTVYSPPADTPAAPRSPGKVHHFEVAISETQVDVTISPYSDDGVSFGPPALVYSQPVHLPFAQGYVVLSLHNHATLKYTSASDPGGVIDASIARIDNVGFDGPVISDWREASAPDALVKFSGEPFQPFQDPGNPENVGYDIAYFVHDAAAGPGPALKLAGVDPSDATSVTLSVTLSVDFLSTQGKPADYTLLARVNGTTWHERRLTPAEAAFFADGPTTLDSEGKPLGDPTTQGRLALLLDIPPDELLSGNNSVEFVTKNVPTNYPPFVYNVDLVMRGQP